MLKDFPVKNYSYILVVIFGCFLYACAEKNDSSALKKTTQTGDSIRVWIDQSKLSNTPLEVKSYLLGKARNRVSKVSNDSVKSRYFRELSLNYLNLKDSLNFRKVNRQAVRFTKKAKDSANLAEVFWDLAAFFKTHNVQDSAYYYYLEAQQTLERIDSQVKAAAILRTIAALQQNIGDYISSNATIIKAIEKLKPLNRYHDLSKSYSILADNAKLLDEPEKALQYYNRSLKYLEIGKVEALQVKRIKHNIALVYQKQGIHEKAIPAFKEVLTIDSLRQKRPRFFGRCLNNLGYSYMKSGQMEKLPEPFFEAQRIQDSINDLGGKSSSSLKLAEYYLLQKDSATALNYLQMTEKLALEVGNSVQRLNALRMLPKADIKNAVKYAEQYIALSDSLQIQERQIRNRFARIQFETDEFIAENEVLAREKQLWTGIAASLILLGLASFIIINQRVKNRILKFRQQQQANNQEIFNLMLAQGEKVEEGKKMEQKRVSEELHDGVLGKMLGARMMLLGLNKKTDPEAIGERAKAISILQDVEGEVRSISHELSHAAYQKIHNFILSIKELVQTIENASKITINFNFTDELDWDALSGEIKINLYRMVQESLQNSVKHAACKNIQMNFYADESLLTVSIADDGKGFVQKRGKRGIGIRNMASRIKKVNGNWDIKSVVGKGTTVTFIIPLVSNDSENAPSISPKENNLQEI